MKHLFTFVIVSVIAFVVYASVDWGSIDLSLSIPSDENTYSGNQSSDEISSSEISETEEDDRLWIDTIMYADGHSFGYCGDVSDWDGWYYDTVRVGDDYMLTYDSIGPSTLRLNLVTRQLTIDLASMDATRQIRNFLGPINGFKRFNKSYTVTLDSVYDEDYGMMRSWGEISFLADYADTCQPNAGKINRFMVDLACNSGNIKMKAPVLTSLYIGYNTTRQSRNKYEGVNNDMAALSEFIKNHTVENWKKEEDLSYIGSAAVNLAVRANIANTRFVTFSVYDYSRIGIGHGGYTQTFHTFDIDRGKELSNTDIFKAQTLDSVKMLLFDVMAGDTHYVTWNKGVESASDVKSRIKGWQSPNPLPEGTKWEEQETESEFTLPQGALTGTGVVFSFQPYEIDCWAAGAYHFIVPYKKLLPYMTPKARRLIDK